MKTITKLKSFVRLDGQGRNVAGSLILRQKMPKVGNWKEILTNECCNDRVLVYTVLTATQTNSSLYMYCNGTLVSKSTTNVNTTTIGGIIIALNNTFPTVGVFSNPSGLIVNLAITVKSMASICKTSSITFEVKAA